MATVTRGEWIAAFLGHRGNPHTPQNQRGMLAWIESEFGQSAPIPARWNPMATTKDAPGATEYNSVGVRNYPDEATGIRALSETLELHAHGYDAIRARLAAGDDALELVDAIHESAWGSKPSRSILDYVTQHESDLLQLAVGNDAGGSPVPVPGGVPPFPGTLLRDFTDDHGTAQWQARMRARGWSIAVDDKYGPASARVCRAFQAEKGLGVDGIVGPITWAAAWTAPVT